MSLRARAAASRGGDIVRIVSSKRRRRSALEKPVPRRRRHLDAHVRRARATSDAPSRNPRLEIKCLFTITSDTLETTLSVSANAADTLAFVSSGVTGALELGALVAASLVALVSGARMDDDDVVADDWGACARAWRQRCALEVRTGARHRLERRQTLARVSPGRSNLSRSERARDGGHTREHRARDVRRRRSASSSSSSRVGVERIRREQSI